MREITHFDSTDGVIWPTSAVAPDDRGQDKPTTHPNTRASTIISDQCKKRHCGAILLRTIAAAERRPLNPKASQYRLIACLKLKTRTREHHRRGVRRALGNIVLISFLADIVVAWRYFRHASLL